ncbi:MAG: lactate utilization protein [Deltaproteobacteria bacterium]|nr:lactate utilization protein [Deltaproteobacteria bacterium]
MNQKIVGQFQKKHESLVGIVHLVSGMSEAVEEAVSLLQLKEAEKVALSELPEEFSHILEQKCAENGMELLKPPFRNADLPQAFDSVQAGISWAAFAIAETGAIVEFTTDDSLRLVTALPLVHISILRASDLISTLKEAAAPIRNFFKDNSLNANVSFISGPSRTADIEMRLILGVHGPAETHAIIVN